MERDYGLFFEIALRKLKIDLTQLCLKLDIDRQTLYNWFDDPNLSFDIIKLVGQEIDCDFKQSFPEFFGELEPNIYLIEDKDLDIEIFKMSIRSVVTAEKVSVFKNGDDAINELLHVSINQPANLPDYIFVDLNMPLLDGWEFIDHFYRLNIHQHKIIKVYILSSSIFGGDIARGTANPLVTEFISKPIGLKKLKSIFKKPD